MIKITLKKTVSALSAACLIIGFMTNAFAAATMLSTPYLNEIQSIPGYINPAHYDEGGEGVAYHANATKNKVQGSFRPNEGVSTGSSTVGHVEAGEWLKYTVNVVKAGEYDVILRFGRPNNYDGPTAIFTLAVNDEIVATFNVDKGTGKDWSTTGRQIAKLPVRLAMGKNVLKVEFVSKGMNFGGLDFREAIPVKGSLKLPDECVIFAPFTRADGVPTTDLLLQVPKSLTLGTVTAEAKKNVFDASRSLNLESYIGEKGAKAVGKTAFIYIPFSVTETGPLTFGFGADWWYEAYLDAKVISSTMEDGNGSWPPKIYDHPVTVDVGSGSHLLVIRFVSGKGSSYLVAGGPDDLRNPYISPVNITNDSSRKTISVSSRNSRQGPPADRKWKMIWNDEFDGTKLNEEKWESRNEHGKWDWPGILTRSSNDMSVLDGQGHYVISLKKDKDGAILYGNKIYSREFKKAYGYFEARMQFSTQPGWFTAFWLSGVPYGEGRDTFVDPQEFDIYEDFYKPKSKYDIQQSYWATSGMGEGTENQNNSLKGFTLGVKKVSRLLDCRTILFEEYGG